MTGRALPLAPDEVGPRERAFIASKTKAEHALDDPARLAARWRLEQRFTLTRPTASQLRTDDVRGRAPACDVCRDPCCARPEGIVSLRLADVARLFDRGLAHAVVEPRALLARFPSIAPALGALLLRDSFTRAFALDKRDDGTCVFFEGGRCAIHDVKPLACRAFPLQVDDDRAGVRFASSCESERAASPDEDATQLTHAIASYHAKVDDVVTRAYARDDVRDLSPRDDGCP